MSVGTTSMSATPRPTSTISTREAYSQSHIFAKDQGTAATERKWEPQTALSNVRDAVDASVAHIESTSVATCSEHDHNVAEVKTSVPFLLGWAVLALTMLTAIFSKVENVDVFLIMLTEFASKLTNDMKKRMTRRLRSFWNLQKRLWIVHNAIPRQIDLHVVRFRDAFNVVRSFPYDLSCEWHTFKGLIKVAFTNRQGLHRVNMGQFFITHTRIGTRLSPRFWKNAVEPGDELIMTMILDDFQVEKGRCPWTSCRANTSDVEFVRGGKFCPKCHRYATTSEENDATAQPRTQRVSSSPSSASTVDKPTPMDSMTSTPDETLEWADPGTLIVAPEVENSNTEDIELYHSIQVVVRVSAAMEMKVTEKGYGRPYPYYNSPSPYDYESDTYAYHTPRCTASPRKLSRPYTYSPVYDGGEPVNYIYQTPRKKQPKKRPNSKADRYFYPGQENIHDEVPKPSKATKPTTATANAKTKTRATSKPIVATATEEDARAAGIPLGYSLKHWDAREKPLFVLGSVFDANSLGKWIYDWTVFCHGSSTPMADVAGDLWLLLIKLTGKLKRAEEGFHRIRDLNNQELVQDFIDSGSRLLGKLKTLLKDCERYMWKAAKREGSKIIRMGQKAGTEFVDSMFGHDRHLDDTEKWANKCRLWNMRFDANCEEVLRGLLTKSKSTRKISSTVRSDSATFVNGQATKLADLESNTAGPTYVTRQLSISDMEVDEEILPPPYALEDVAIHYNTTDESGNDK